MIVLRNHDLVVGILVNIQKGYLFPIEEEVLM